MPKYYGYSLDGLVHTITTDPKEAPHGVNAYPIHSLTQAHVDKFMEYGLDFVFPEGEEPPFESDINPLEYAP